MNWEMIGAIGEIGGAIAVVVTLAYLARQIRDSAAQDRRNQYVQLNRNISQFADAQARDLELSDTVLRGSQDLDSLDPAESLRFSAAHTMFFRGQEALFHHHRQGGVDDWGFDSYRLSGGDVARRAGVRAWWAHRRHWFSAEFQEEVDRWMSEDSSDFFLRPYDPRSTPDD